MAKAPMTAALRALDAAAIPYTSHPYAYVERGGTKASSTALGVDEHVVIKTLVLRTDAGRPLVALMHGDREVSMKELARALGTKSVEPCDPDEAQRHSGYLVGGTSPFGLRKPMPIVVEATVLELPRVFINGGRRGLLVSLDPSVFVSALAAVPVRVAR